MLNLEMTWWLLLLAVTDKVEKLNASPKIERQGLVGINNNNNVTDRIPQVI